MATTVERPEHGPMVGHVTRATARIWLRKGGHATAWVRYRAVGGNGDWACVAAPLVPEQDSSGVVEVPFPPGAEAIEYQAGAVREAGSTPDQLDWGGIDSSCGARVHRAPASGSGFTFLLGSCRHRGFGPLAQGDRAFGTIARQQANRPDDFMVLCGDQVYCDSSDNVFPVPVLPGLMMGPPKSLEGYFRKYREDYALPNYREVTRGLPTYACFDDHEVQNDWRGYQYRVQPGQSKAERKPDTLRHGLLAYAAYQAAHSPLALPQAGEPADWRWWYRFDWGGADFFVLDGRARRQPPDAGSATMLGREQYEDLVAFLKEDDGRRWKFIVSAVPFAPDTDQRDLKTVDTWKAYPRERFDLLEFMRKELRRRPIVLSGDIHLSCVSVIRHRDDPSFRLPCITSSALNWFTFGVADTDGAGIPGVRPKLEEGTLPINAAEVAQAPGARKGPYRAVFESRRELKNNFVRLSVEPERVQADIHLGSTGEVTASWAVTRAEMERA